MGILSSLIYNPNRSSSRSRGVSLAVKKQREDEDKKRRDAQARAWKQARSTVVGGANPVVFQGITFKNAGGVSQEGQNFGYNLLSQAGYGAGSGYGEDGYGGDGSGGYGGGGLSGGVGGSNGTGGSSGAKSTMSKSERDKLYKMKDSNVPYYYEHDENDLMYLAASEKRDYAWGFKEEVFLYTMHDRQKHRYITSFNIDSDAKDITTTCTINMPYKAELMDYYIPSKTVFMLIGGVYDREVLFIGRVSEVAQQGDSIQVTGQNIGWKFKEYIPIEFEKKLAGLPVPLAVKAIFKELGFTEGKYHMDLWAIPNVFKYKLTEDLGVEFKGETVQNVPELTEVVQRMKDSDINKYVASKAKLKDTKAAAEAYDKKTLVKLSSVQMSSTSGYSSSYRKNYGISTSIKKGEISYDPLEDRLLGTDKSIEYFTNHEGGQGEHTYEEVMNTIASAIDAQFFIVDTTVCFVSFNALMAMTSSEAIVKAIQPRLEYWQLKEDSLEVDINQYGYYNTVIIKYKNGKLKRAFDDLVRVYGEIPITYEEPDLNREGAQLKAQAYLAAHVRDFGMEVRATILHTGKITVASFIKVQNPLTMSESLLYVYGQSIQWDAQGQTITCDLDLRYGPENPDGLEIPEYGVPYSNTSTSTNATGATGNVPANIAEAARQIVGNATNPTQKGLLIYNWVDANIVYEKYDESKYSTTQVLQGKQANCWDTAMLIYDLCTAVGVKCEVHNGYFHFATSGSIGHLWNKIEQNGQMVFADTGRTPNNPIGSLGGGYIESDTLMKKNY